MRPLPAFLALTGLVSSSLLAATPARADVPTCSGTPTAQGKEALEQGKAHYRRGRTTPVNADEMRAAIASYDAACAEGDARALEFRAYALFALERYVDAAESLDAFLVDHPLVGLPRDVHDRVSAQMPAITAKVATVHVSSDAPTAQVSVAGRVVGPAPAQARVLARTPVEIQVTAPGFEPMKRTVTVEADAEDNESFAMLPVEAQVRIDAPEGAEVIVDGTAVGHAPMAPIRHAAGPIEITVTMPGSDPRVHHLVLALGEDRTETFTFGTVAPTPEAPVTPPPDKAKLMKWVYVTGGASLAMVAAGAGFTAWRNNRTSTYDASCLGKQVAGCSDTLSQFHAAQDLEITAFTLAGGLAVTAGVLFVMDRKSDPTKPASTVSFTCAPGLGIVCAGAF